jgi:hypothetical protein
LIDAMGGMVSVTEAARHRDLGRRVKRDALKAQKKRPDLEGPGEVIGSPMTEVTNTKLARARGYPFAGQFI